MSWRRAGTPPDIVEKYNKRHSRDPEPARREGAARCRRRFDPVTDQTPEQFAAFIKSEIAKWAPVVKASGASVE